MVLQPFLTENGRTWAAPLDLLALPADDAPSQRARTRLADDGHVSLNSTFIGRLSVRLGRFAIAMLATVALFAGGIAFMLLTSLMGHVYPTTRRTRRQALASGRGLEPGR